MKNLFNRFVREESGQDIIEYVLLAAFISVVAWTHHPDHRQRRDQSVPGHPGRHGRASAAGGLVSDLTVTGGRPPVVRLSSLS